MKKYSIAMVIVACFCVFMLWFLSASFKPVSSLMKPPKPEGENLEIQLTFEKFAGKNYHLKQPLGGKYRSAYTFIDLNGDSEQEVIVFYSLESNVDIVRMNVLKVVDGQWKSIADFESLHNEIQEIAFADLNGDKLKEIIVGWSTYQDDYSKLMSIYKIDNSGSQVTIKDVHSESYSLFDIIDIDNNGIKDILNIRYMPMGKIAEYTASFLCYDNNRIVEKASVFLNRAISSVTSITSDKGGYDSGRRIFIDGYKIDSGITTDCFMWDNNRQSFSRYKLRGQSISSLTSRRSSIGCEDINNDGLIELPVEEFLPASSVVTQERTLTEERQSIIRWVNITDNEIKTAGYQIINSQNGYRFDFPEQWLGKITTENNLTEGVITFCELKYDSSGYSRGMPVFAIKTFTDPSGVSHFMSNYDFITKHEGRYHYCRLYEKAEDYDITFKKVSKNLIVW